MSDPRLGWWVQLVECSSFDDNARLAVFDNWGCCEFGSIVLELNWPEHQPQPNMLMLYGTAEDPAPAFDEMAEQVRPFMDDDQYFAFIFMKDTVLARGGLECVVITKYSVLRINGLMMINSAIECALDADARWRDAIEEQTGENHGDEEETEGQAEVD